MNGSAVWQHTMESTIGGSSPTWFDWWMETKTHCCMQFAFKLFCSCKVVCNRASRRFGSVSKFLVSYYNATSLIETWRRCMQSALRKEAALSAVDEQRHNKEAVEAENAANIAKMAEHEAAVSQMLCLPNPNLKRNNIPRFTRATPQTNKGLAEELLLWIKTWKESFVCRSMAIKSSLLCRCVGWEKRSESYNWDMMLLSVLWLTDSTYWEDKSRFITTTWSKPWDCRRKHWDRESCWIGCLLFVVQKRPDFLCILDGP